MYFILGGVTVGRATAIFSDADFDNCVAGMGEGKLSRVGLVNFADVCNGGLPMPFSSKVDLLAPTTTLGVAVG